MNLLDKLFGKPDTGDDEQDDEQDEWIVTDPFIKTREVVEETDYAEKVEMRIYKEEMNVHSGETRRVLDVKHDSGWQQKD